MYDIEATYLNPDEEFRFAFTVGPFTIFDVRTNPGEDFGKVEWRIDDTTLEDVPWSRGDEIPWEVYVEKDSEIVLCEAGTTTVQKPGY